MAAGGSSDRPRRRHDAAEQDEAGGLLTDAAVDPLAEQVGVAEVACVLLDHVEYHLAQRDGRAPRTLERIFRTAWEYPEDVNWTFGPGQLVAAAAVVAVGLPAGETVVREIPGTTTTWQRW